MSEELRSEMSTGERLREAHRDAIGVASSGMAFIAAVTRYEEVYHDDAPPSPVIAVEWRGPGNDWCVIDSAGFVYSKTGKPRFEPRPSNRTDAFKRRYRFSLTHALVIAGRVARRRDQEREQRHAALNAPVEEATHA